METPGTELARVANRLQLQILPVELEKFETEFLDNELRHTVFQVDDLNQDDWTCAKYRQKQIYNLI